MPQDLKVTVLINVCSKELLDYTELKNKDLGGRNARDQS